MNRKSARKSISMILVIAILATMIGSVFAYDLTGKYKEYAPTAPVTSANSDILTGATAAANTPVLSILGINVTSSDAAGVLNAASDYTVPMNLIIFGSEWNENPDPYLQGFYYNINCSEITTGGNTAYSLADNGDWDGLYTLINEAKSGPSGGVNNEDTTLIKVDGLEEKNCNIIFYYEPDVLLAGSAGAYDVGLTHYNSSPNRNYDPLVVDGWATNGNKAYCLNDGTFASTVAMANGVYVEGYQIQEYADSIEKEGRYGSIIDCAETYSNFALGIYYYAQSLLYPEDEDSLKLNPIRYCTALEVNEGENGTTYTISYESSRMSQYADGLGTLISSSEPLLLTDLKDEVDVVISSKLDADDVETLRKAGIKVLDALPDTVYGTFAQAPDNILGLPYVFAYFYGDQLKANGITLTEADVTAYFVKNIYHVDEGFVDEAVTLMMEAIDDSDVDEDISEKYDAVVSCMIDKGIAYYQTLSSDDELWVDWYAINGIPDDAY